MSRAGRVSRLPVAASVALALIALRRPPRLEADGDGRDVDVYRGLERRDGVSNGS